MAVLLSAFDGLIFTYATTLLETTVQEASPEAARGRLFAMVTAYGELTSLLGQLAGGVLAVAAGVLGGLCRAAGLTAVAVILVFCVQMAKERTVA